MPALPPVKFGLSAYSLRGKPTGRTVFGIMPLLSFSNLIISTTRLDRKGITMARVAFIGLGVMGYPMAGYIAKGGHEVTVYNRTAAKAEAWVKEYGGNSGKTPAEAAQDCDFVFCCVGNDDDLRSVTTGENGAFNSIKEGAVFIDNTTASAAVARELANAAAERKFDFLDCAGFRRPGWSGKRNSDCDGRR